MSLPPSSPPSPVPAASSAVGPDGTAAAEVLPVDYGGPFKDRKDALVRAFEREYLVRLLARTRGNIARAAREADLDRKHLYSLLHKYGLVQGEPSVPRAPDL